MIENDFLLPLAFSVDRAEHCVRALDIFGQDAKISVGVSTGEELKMSGHLSWTLPADASLGLRLRLSMRKNQSDRTWEGPLHYLRDITPPHLAVSATHYDELRGLLYVRGWAIGIPKTGFISLFAGGEAVANAQSGLNRPDVHSRHPLICPTSGFFLEASLENKRGPLELRATDLAGRPISLVALPFPDDLAAAGPSLLTRLASRAKLMPRKRLEHLIASEPFRRRWQAGVSNAAPRDSACLVAREAIANELGGRLGRGEEIAVRLADGDLVHCCPIDDPCLARRYLADGHDELGFLRWLAKIVQPGDTVIDGGAAYGVMSRTMARRGAYVLAIEADAYSAERLRRVGLSAPPGRIDLVEAALVSYIGKVTFAGLGRSMVGSGKVLVDPTGESLEAFLDEINSLSQVSLTGKVARAAEQQTITAADVQLRQVSAVSLDGLCVSHGLRDIALVKIDIEGGELDALRGGSQLLSGCFGRSPVVAFEYSDLFPTRGGKREEILALLWRHGYRIFRLSKGKSGGGDLVPVTTISEAPTHDNLIAFPPGACSE